MIAAARRPSPLSGARPTKEDLKDFANANPNAVDDILPADNTRLRLLIVGVNPGLWTAAVNAPFARPGNRFWPALYEAQLTDYLIDASRGLSVEDADHMITKGIGLTNLVGRATVRADELSREELRQGKENLTKRLEQLRPRTVAIAGITAFRVAFQKPKAILGKQDTSDIPGWPRHINLWVVPQPSGLNAHHNVASLADYWRQVWGQH